MVHGESCGDADREPRRHEFARVRLLEVRLGRAEKAEHVAGRVEQQRRRESQPVRCPRR